MKLIIILTIIGIIVGWLRGLKRYDSNRDDMSLKEQRISWFFEILGGLIVGALVGFLLSLLISLWVKGDRVAVEVDRVDIHAMADGSGIQGSFFLGSGRIENQEYYYYYESLDNGGFKQRKVPVGRVTIYEDVNDMDAYLIKYKLILPSEHWSIGWSIFEEGCSCTDGSTGPFDFHIPKGSVKHNFNLDLK